MVDDKFLEIKMVEETGLYVVVFVLIIDLPVSWYDRVSFTA